MLVQPEKHYMIILMQFNDYYFHVWMISFNIEGPNHHDKSVEQQSVLYQYIISERTDIYMSLSCASLTWLSQRCDKWSENELRRQETMYPHTNKPTQSASVDTNRDKNKTKHPSPEHISHLRASF